MIIDPKRKAVHIGFEEYEDLQQAFDDIEKTALGNGVGSDEARDICSSLNLVRDTLNLPRGIQRHEKWAK